MKIVDKIDEIHNFVKTPAGALKGATMQNQCGLAILNGIKSPEWKTYMCNFASNPDQLKRLIGEDAAFMQTTWGPHSLAYLAANSTCGTGTTVNTKANMPDLMIQALDAGLSSGVAPTDCPDSLALKTDTFI